MAEHTAPRGLIVDLVTPLKTDGSLDGRGLGRLLDRVAPFSEAVLIGGPAGGEGSRLEFARRLELLKMSLAVLRGRLPLMVWITRESTEKTFQGLLDFQRILESRAYGAPVFWVDAPLYYHSNRGLPAFYARLTTAAPQPFLLYNDPDFIGALSRPLKRNNIRTAVLKELCRNTRVAGLVFRGNLDRARNYQRAVRSRDHFRIYDGSETHFLQHPSMSGVVSVGANLDAGKWHEATRFSLMTGGPSADYPGTLEQALQLGAYLRRLGEIYENAAVPVIKAALFRMGVIESPACLDYREDAEEKGRRIMEMMDRGPAAEMR